MREVLDKKTGAILFKKTEEDKRVDKLEEEVAELKKALAALTKKSTKS